MRKACSTRSTYSAGESSPTMSVQLRISVLRFRQLSMRRLYKAHERVFSESPARGRELPAGALEVPALHPEARGCEVMEAAGLLVVEAGERVRGGRVLLPLEVALGPPDRRPPPRVRRG